MNNSDSVWESPLKMSDSSLILDDGQTEAIRSDLEQLRWKMNDESRLVLSSESAFTGKLENVCKVLSERIEEGPGGPWFDVLKNTSIAFFDNGKNGLGRRGTIFTRFAIIVVDKEYPKIIDGEPAGIIPWKFFYKLGKPENETSYCLFDMKDLTTSPEVSDEIKTMLNGASGDVKLLFRFGAEGVGLAEKDVVHFMEELKGSIGDYDVFDEEEDEADDEEEEDEADDDEDE